MPQTSTLAFAAAIIVAAGAGVGGWYALQPANDILAECGGGMATGGTQIGGPFELVDHTGKTVNEADIIDKPTLLYFGYTFCPDVCPIDTATMAQAKAILGDEGRIVNSAFVTIDPARDTTESLSEYVENLDPTMVALTGTEEQIAAAAKAYRVFYQKVDGDDPDYYLMDHSAFIYLVAPEVGFLDVFRHGEPPDSIAETTACYVDALTG